MYLWNDTALKHDAALLSCFKMRPSSMRAAAQLAAQAIPAAHKYIIQHRNRYLHTYLDTVVYVNEVSPMDISRTEPGAAVFGYS